jgi:hypothetical protein
MYNYASKTNNANKRMRVKGRFVTQEEQNKIQKLSYD